MGSMYVYCRYSVGIVDINILGIKLVQTNSTGVSAAIFYLGGRCVSITLRDLIKLYKGI